MASIMSARDRALGVAELLEMILEKLPMRDLLFMQRVSKTWRANIESSTKLQEMLFLKAKSTMNSQLTFHVDESIDTQLRDDPDYMLNYKTTIYDAPPSEERSQKLGYMWHSTTNPGVSVPVKSNPLLYAFVDELNRSFKRDPRMTLASAWARPEASWRRMLLCQPRIQTTMILEVGDDVYGDKELFDLSSGVNDDIRLGQIDDNIRLRAGDLKEIVTSMRATEARRTFVDLSIEGIDLWDCEEEAFVANAGDDEDHAETMWLIRK